MKCGEITRELFNFSPWVNGLIIIRLSDLNLSLEGRGGEITVFYFNITLILMVTPEASDYASGVTNRVAKLA